MKTLLFTLTLFFSVSAFSATRIQCDAEGNRFIIESSSSSDLRVTFKNETVRADGYLGSDEVDLVARFNSIGEMTLFAKVGKVSSDSYIFMMGRKLSVVCR